jgi:hypothetical protein
VTLGSSVGKDSRSWAHRGATSWETPLVSLLFLIAQLGLTQLAELELLSDVVNDLDVDFSANPAAAESHKRDQRNIRKIREATANLKINLIHPLREGKRLLVLDIDYS